MNEKKTPKKLKAKHCKFSKIMATLPKDIFFMNILIFLDFCEYHVILDYVPKNQRKKITKNWLSFSRCEKKVNDDLGEKRFLVNGKLHRIGGPACIRSYRQEWYINDKLHNLDGPAILESNGNFVWYKNGKKHRDQKDKNSGPAVRKGSIKEWWLNGKLHFFYGPAIINSSYSAWYDNGKKTKTKFNKIVKV